MNQKVTLFIIGLLVLLFVSIEAANAGLAAKLKHLIGSALSFRTLALSSAVVLLGIVIYFALIDKSLDAFEKQKGGGSNPHKANL